MKLIKWLVFLAVFWVGVYLYVITDRDRSMWVLNTALKAVTPIDVTTDLVYGEKPWQTLDVYPAATADGATGLSPVLLFIHGGGWYHGRKDQYYFAADAFVREGYTVVVPNYVKHPSPDARFPAHLEDAAAAMAWTLDNIEAYGGNRDAVFVSGHSAGAHTAVLLTTDRRFLDDAGVSVEDIAGVAAIAGPYRFTPDTEATQAVFGPASRYPLMDPLAYVDGDEPAMLVLHSDLDQSIANHHPVELERALRAVNGDVETLIYPDLTHADMVTHLHPWFARDKTLASEIDEFFRARISQRTEP